MAWCHQTRNHYLNHCSPKFCVHMASLGQNELIRIPARTAISNIYQNLILLKTTYDEAMLGCRACGIEIKLAIWVNLYYIKTTEHHSDVIIGTMASQITSLISVYLTVYSSADQRKHQSSASLAFVRGIHRRPLNSPHKGPVTRKMFPFDDVIMYRPKSLHPYGVSRPKWVNKDTRP